MGDAAPDTAILASFRVMKRAVPTTEGIDFGLRRPLSLLCEVFRGRAAEFLHGKPFAYEFVRPE